MAKSKKTPKNEASKPDNNSSEAIVLHQKLCLSIDVLNHRFYGYTELEVAVPDTGIIGLHAENLEIERVTVDGEPADFDVFPHYQPVEIENRWCSVSSVDSAADAAGVTYISALERELVPNLLILCRKSIAAGIQQQDHLTHENGEQSNSDVKQNVKLVRIDYWVEKAEAGVHFDDQVMHTNSQIRRAHCWFPCMDDNLQRCCYDLEFTVPHNFIAVSNGTLLYQVLTKDDPPRKTFVYKLSIPVSARWISLAVAPFQVLPDYHNSLLSHMCLTGSLPKLQNTVGFFSKAFSHYESYLNASFPFGSYKQVFIAPEMVISSATLGASMSVFSSHILFDEKVIDQTIDTRIKLLYALAQQWFGVYVTPETPNDEWLIEGLAGFLTDTFVREFLGNNEARYRRYKANCAVCKADDSGTTSLSPSSSQKDLYGTQSIGLYGRVRSWKSVAILQMLEKQMGPDLFKKILQTIVSRAKDNSHSMRTLSTKEFRHHANKIGNLERPFLKEFFHQWVETCGCPVLRMGFSYNKRKNLVELAAFRECTAAPNASLASCNGNADCENQGDSGWPGMMTIKVHELDGTHDHLLPMAGDAWQLLEIKCHSRLATKRFQKPKKGSKPDGSDDNCENVTTVDIRSGAESPLLWLRADPEMEYLAEIHFSQPVQMWINQLEKDRDVVAQVQAIGTLEEFRNITFPVINALTNFVSDSKAFWRVRVEAAFALAKIASEETDWAGMLSLVKYYKAKRFDPSIGLPKPNDFHDFAEYFVLEAIPHAVATVRTVDRKSPREAVEFVLQVLKYNDNSRNPYSDVFWLSALVEAVGELEFGQQGIVFLASLLKRLDRLLQFDRLMPSYNGILTVSCIRTLTQMALKLSYLIPIDHVLGLIKQFQDLSTMWQIRIEASRALLDIEFQCKGMDAALILFMKYLEEEPTLRGQAKLGIHMTRMSQISVLSGSINNLKSQTLVALLRLLESRLAFRNVFLRHHLFCILQVLSGRRPTLYVIPREHLRQTGYVELCSEQRNTFLAFINQMNPVGIRVENHSPFQGGMDQDTVDILNSVGNDHEQNTQNNEASKDMGPISSYQMDKVTVQVDPVLNNQETVELVNSMGNDHKQIMYNYEASKDVGAVCGYQVDKVPGQVDPVSINQEHNIKVQEDSRDVDTISSNQVHEVSVHKTSNDLEPILSIPMAEVPVQHTLIDLDTYSNDHMDKALVKNAPKDADTISNCQEKKMPVLKFRVKQTVTSNKVEGATNTSIDRYQSGHKRVDPAASSSVSVDAAQRNIREVVSVSNQVAEEVNSCQGRGSQMTASIGSAKVPREGDESGRELQCTADSSSIHHLIGHSSPNFATAELTNMEVQKNEGLQAAPFAADDVDGGSLSTVNPEHGRKYKEKKDKKRKRDGHKSHRDDPEYLERKHLKKEMKKKEKAKAKLLEEQNAVSGDGVLRKEEPSSRSESQNRLLDYDKKAASTELSDDRDPSRKVDNDIERPSHQLLPSGPATSTGKDQSEYREANTSFKSTNINRPNIVFKTNESKPKAPEGSSGTKLRIKIKTKKP